MPALLPAFSPKEGRGCAWACGAWLCSCYLPAVLPVPLALGLPSLSCLPPSPLKRGEAAGSPALPNMAYFVPFSAFAAALLNLLREGRGSL